MQICEDGLERLFELTTANVRQSLIDKIKPEMDVLMRNELSGYLEFKDGKYPGDRKIQGIPEDPTGNCCEVAGVGESDTADDSGFFREEIIF